MVHLCRQTVFKIILISLLLVVNSFGKDVPLMKTMTVNIPNKEYSILEFPFKIIDIQKKTFNYKMKVTKIVKKSQVYDKNNITNKFKKNKSSKVLKAGNVLNMKTGINVITFKPKYEGNFEIIVWGYTKFPVILKINIVESGSGNKTINFLDMVENNSDVDKFESNSHEKIIENISRHLYDDSYKSKPSGYESIVKNEEYNIEIIEDKKVIGVLKNTLLREIVGRGYLGQVWNVNLKNPKKENLIIELYEELFDSDGIYGISLETYDIDSKNGTRVMIVRRR